MSLKGKVAIVSGGSRGIGKEIVISFAEKGAIVYFTYFKNEESAKEIERLSISNGWDAHPVYADIRVESEVKKLVKDVYAEQKQIDIIVNNAGIKKDKTLAFMSSMDWKDVIHSNLDSIYNLTNAAIFYMLKRKAGRIIMISSVSGLNGISGQTNYSASKAGMIGFTKALAKEVAAYGISVNAVAPGGVETDMIADMSEVARDALISNVPLKRLCKPAEIARVVDFLADEEAAPEYLTGTVIILDGGQGS